jgi:hypothetical protein
MGSFLAVLARRVIRVYIWINNNHLCIHANRMRYHPARIKQQAWRYLQNACSTLSKFEQSSACFSEKDYLRRL